MWAKCAKNPRNFKYLHVTSTFSTFEHVNDHMFDQTTSSSWNKNMKFMTFELLVVAIVVAYYEWVYVETINVKTLESRIFKFQVFCNYLRFLKQISNNIGISELLKLLENQIFWKYWSLSFSENIAISIFLEIFRIQYFQNNNWQTNEQTNTQNKRN